MGGNTGISYFVVIEEDKTTYERLFSLGNMVLIPNAIYLLALTNTLQQTLLTTVTVKHLL